jgi:glycosyltransferase involved in cell wall biosynthesis
MTLDIIDKEQIDAAIDRAMSLTSDEIAALSYEDALYLWRHLVFVAERLELNAESAKMREKMANRADELFYTVAEFEVKNPPIIDKPLNVFTISPFTERAWCNATLARDKGYTPYFLSKLTGGRCVFFFCDENDTFPVKKNLPGAEFVKTGDISFENYKAFIKEHIDEMDILVTDDIGGNSFGLLPLYKRLKPDGKIIHVTDINNVFYKRYRKDGIADRLNEWLLLPDAYTAASRLGRDIMNADPLFPAPVYFNSNAYMPEISDEKSKVTASGKENIIMTAGRIGSVQKNNGVLIRAFAQLSNDFPDFKLVLAGPYEEAAKTKLMNDALNGLNISKELLSRIIFTGGLTKKELYKYYAKAKVFCLTSTLEGGTPNVFSEALANGCYMVIADRIDAAPEMTTAAGRNIGVPYDATNFSKLNDNFTLDIDEKAEALSLANTLSGVLPNLTESFFETHIKKCREYLEHDFDYKKNSIKLYRLLFD